MAITSGLRIPCGRRGRQPGVHGTWGHAGQGSRFAVGETILRRVPLEVLFQRSASHFQRSPGSFQRVLLAAARTSSAVSDLASDFDGLSLWCLPRPTPPPAHCKPLAPTPLSGLQVPFSIQCLVGWAGLPLLTTLEHLSVEPTLFLPLSNVRLSLVQSWSCSGPGRGTEHGANPGVTRPDLTLPPPPSPLSPIQSSPSFPSVPASLVSNLEPRTSTFAHPTSNRFRLPTFLMGLSSVADPPILD